MRAEERASRERKKTVVLIGLCALAPLARGAVTTNVWQTAAGGSINSAANWVGATEDWTDNKVNRGFLDFRALDSGASVTMSSPIAFSGFWFAPAPEATGPFTWSLPTDNVWWVGSGTVSGAVSGAGSGSGIGSSSPGAGKSSAGWSV